MILDNRAIFSDQQAITATAASTNVMDLQALGLTYDLVQLKRRQGIKDIPLFLKVTEDFDALTSLTIAIETSDAEGFGSGVVTVFSVSVLLADLVVGYKFPLPYLPKNITKRYVRFKYTVSGSNPTVGKISSGLTCGSADESYVG